MLTEQDIKNDQRIFILPSPKPLEQQPELDDSVSPERQSVLEYIPSDQLSEVDDYLQTDSDNDPTFVPKFKVNHNQLVTASVKLGEGTHNLEKQNSQVEKQLTEITPAQVLV